MSQLKSVNYVDTSMPGPSRRSPARAEFLLGQMRARLSGGAELGDRCRLPLSQLGDVPGIDGAGTTNNAAVFKNLSAQEARIGFRFLLD